MTTHFANASQAADWFLDESKPQRGRVEGALLLPIETVERLEEAEDLLGVHWWHRVANDTAKCPPALPVYYERG